MLLWLGGKIFAAFNKDRALVGNCQWDFLDFRLLICYTPEYFLVQVSYLHVNKILLGSSFLFTCQQNAWLIVVVSFLFTCQQNAWLIVVVSFLFTSQQNAWLIVVVSFLFTCQQNAWLIAVVRTKIFDQ